MDINENIYRTNGFRILGLDITSKNRRIDNRIAKVDRFMERNNFKDDEPLKDVFDKSKNDFLLPVKPEPSFNEYHDAKNRLYDVETRLVDEIFWFWPKTFDSKLEGEIVEYLKENNYNKAISYWEDISNTNTMNMTSIHNLAVLYHVRALDGFLEGKGNKKLFSDLELSLNYWSQIVNSNNFKDFVKERVNDIKDPRLNEEFVDEIFDDLPHNLLNINYIFIKKILNSGKLSKRKQDYIFKYIDSIQKSPFDKSVISGFNSKITKSIDDSIKEYKEPFESSFESSNDDEKQDLLIEYSENILPYLSILHNSFNDYIVSSNLINDSCRFIYNRIPNTLLLILMKVSDEERFNKFMEITESLKEFTTDDELKEKLDTDLQLRDLGNEEQDSEPTVTEPTIPTTEEYTVRVKIRDNDGDDLSNVDVTLTNIENDKKYYGETDTSGSCNISYLPPGRYSCKAAKMGYDTYNGTLRVSEDNDLMINLNKDNKPNNDDKPEVPTGNTPTLSGGGSSYNRNFIITVAAVIFISLAFYAVMNFL
ncbi:carboxypeptidase-like regulatory domain-containing protein [uncultured Methanobrevibacter sp.]|uniref:carboxypeptidase-like regulatory domain-containing protein n=1 Tax=uncultured Methanobrevibacter sp. TaxID=253161 RepID=UPI0026045D94|nr:carboxypeptidase-like regulatory domain-containing protein [uncultured Methanobrevibacter sp.]